MSECEVVFELVIYFEFDTWFFDRYVALSVLYDLCVRAFSNVLLLHVGYCCPLLRFVDKRYG